MREAWRVLFPIVVKHTSRFWAPLGLILFASACSASGDELGSSSGEAEGALTSAVDCSRETEPAYSGGKKIGTVDVVRIGNKRVSLKTAHAFLYLQKKANEEGIDISINSGFRTMSEQQYFYDCYRSGSCNNGNLAAKPGYSNHQNGRALDIGGDRPELNRLIARLGLDWRRTVPKEAWHYEYYGPWFGGPCGTQEGQSPADEMAGLPPGERSLADCANDEDCISD